MRQVKVAVVQMRCTGDTGENIARAEQLAREAAAGGARIILLPELLETPYFCQKQKPEYYRYAVETENNRAVQRFRETARELGAVIPVSFYEKRHNALFNSVAVIDADGAVLGVYRKSHIPDGPGYQEKFYFSPGDTGFKVWPTRYGRIGLGICWDQWFPEAARVMTLMGAEILLYPTAIGSEPGDPAIDSRDHWQTCMLGHAAANLVPVAAANRVGTETVEESEITFYGSSFIAGPQGQKIAAAGREEETVLTGEFDLDRLQAERTEWGVFRDRRPELYKALVTHDGTG